MSHKKRILLAAEFTGLSTGYGNYGRELLARLLATGRYEVAEYSSYIHTGDPRSQAVPWPVIGVEPHPANEHTNQVFASNKINEFGRLNFEEALLTFLPDVVLSYRDPWADGHVADSPFKRYFRWVYSPTIDSAPQEQAWLSMFAKADQVLTYTDWGGEVLREQSGGMINPLGSATPIPDDCFVPTTDKRGAKAALGFDPDCLIVGSAMRSQPRKLIPDLMEAFALFLQRAPENLAKRTFLALHTSFPDVSWSNLAELLQEYGIMSKTYFTYLCHHCTLAFPSFFCGAKTSCPRCGGVALMPSTRKGVSRDQLVGLFQAWDFAVQYSVCEGLGMPAMEAAACGVPVAAVDYSAMSEVVRNVRGFPLKVQRMFWDHGTSSRRALPDNAFLACLLADFLSLPTMARDKKGFETRQSFERSYSWEKTVGAWVNAIETCPPPEAPWNAPPLPFPPPIFDLNVASDDEFLTRCIKYGVGRKDLLGGYLHARLGRDLSIGCRHPGFEPLSSEFSVGLSGPVDFTRHDVIEELRAVRHFSEHWEMERIRRFQK